MWFSSGVHFILYVPLSFVFLTLLSRCFNLAAILAGLWLGIGIDFTPHFVNWWRTCKHCCCG
tara:strand:- start:855 stop:1040 length:186 start_codon:yes stop_codon:yes gene_type:complete